MRSKADTSQLNLPLNLPLTAQVRRRIYRLDTVADTSSLVFRCYTLIADEKKRRLLATAASERGF